MGKDLNVFKGKGAIQEYLNPGNISYLPLVELPETLNPFAKDRVRIFGKLMTFIGSHNVKAVPAYNMMAEKYERGELAGVTNVIENSSGNTITAIAVASRQFGVGNIRAFVPDEISRQKLMMLLFFGITPVGLRAPLSTSAIIS